MSRQWNYYGFNPAARAILDETIQIGVKDYTITYFDGSPQTTGSEPVMIMAYAKEKYDYINPWYDERRDLHILRFSDGRVFEEYVQAEPWSSGPCTFMALRDHITKEPIAETLWPQEEIDGY